MNKIIMNNKRKFFLIFAIFSLMVMISPALANGRQTYHEDYRQRQKSVVYGPMGCSDSEMECTEYGKATLRRKNNRVILNLRTSGLEPNAAYTVWYVVFNNPEYCTGTCGSDDLSNPDVAASLLWGAGQISDYKGRARFGTELYVGGAPGEIVSGPGLLDADKAEIHAVLRTHGPLIPNQAYAQLTTLGGGCEINTCINQQFAIFP